MSQHSATQALAELGRDERRQPDAVAAGRDGGEEVCEMGADHPVEDPVVGDRGT